MTDQSKARVASCLSCTGGSGPLLLAVNGASDSKEIRSSYSRGMYVASRELRAPRGVSRKQRQAQQKEIAIPTESYPLSLSMLTMLAPSATAAAAVVAVALTCSTEASAFVAPAAWSTAASTAAAAPAPVRTASRAAIPTSAATRRSSSSGSCSLRLGDAFRPAPAPAASGGRHGNPLMAASSSPMPMGEYTSSRGLVFPTDKEEGWFDSATVGSPRVHRCERAQ